MAQYIDKEDLYSQWAKTLPGGPWHCLVPMSGSCMVYAGRRTIASCADSTVADAIAELPELLVRGSYTSSLSQEQDLHELCSRAITALEKCATTKRRKWEVQRDVEDLQAELEELRKG